MRPPIPTIIYAQVEGPEGRGGAVPLQRQRRHLGEARQLRPMQGQYYSKVQVDPANPDRVYIQSVNIMVSDDGGRTVTALGTRNKHVDNHDIWVDPKNNNHYLVGCDGGLYETYDRAATWNFKEQPAHRPDVRRHGQRGRAVLLRLRRHAGQQQLRLPGQEQVHQR